jgi:hypothetical protein
MPLDLALLGSSVSSQYKSPGRPGREEGGGDQALSLVGTVSQRIHAGGPKT